MTLKSSSGTDSVDMLGHPRPNRLFFERLEEAVETRLKRFHPQKAFCPLEKQEEYEVDYSFSGRKVPCYLFGVNGPDKAKLATICCLKFQAERLRFLSLIVLESIDVLRNKDLARLMSAADKHFPSLDDFLENGERFLEREAG